MKSLCFKKPFKYNFFAPECINSVQYRFKDMSSLISENVDILIVAETTLDSSSFDSRFSPPFST